MWDNVFLFLDDAELWKGVAFFISIGLISVPIYRLLIKWVKIRSNHICSHWHEALKLRREAEDLLKSVQQKNFYKDVERKKIMQAGLKEARALKENTQLEQAQYLKDKKQEILDRVNLIQKTGLADLNRKVLSLSTDITKNVLMDLNEEKKDFMSVAFDELATFLEKDSSSLKSAILAK